MRSVPTFVEIMGQEVKVFIIIHLIREGQSGAHWCSAHWCTDPACARPQDPFQYHKEAKRSSLHSGFCYITTAMCECLNTEFLPEGKITVIHV